MSLVKWNRSLLSPSVDAWMDSFFDNGPVELIQSSMAMPAVNIVENVNDYTLELAVPGRAKEDFKLEIESNTLRVSTESQTENESENKNYKRREYSYSSFARCFTLPDNINPDDVSAQYSEGILTIVVPKTEVNQEDKRIIAIT